MSAPHEAHGFSPLDYRPYNTQDPDPHRDEPNMQYDQREGRDPLPTSNLDQKSTDNRTSPFLDPPEYNNESFVDKPVNDTEFFQVKDAHFECKENSNKQLKFILVSGIGGCVLTLMLCYAYYAAIAYWQNKSPVSRFQKRVFNAVSTAISIALGLNLSSALKNIALNMRWLILSARKHNLVEVEHILAADSLKELVKLTIVTSQPRLIFGCIIWMLLNIITQVGIAALSLTYNFDQDLEKSLWKEGTGSVPALDHFYPEVNLPSFSQSLPDEEYTAHMYGEFGFMDGIGAIEDEPPRGKIYTRSDPLIYIDQNRKYAEFIFFDSPENAGLNGPFSTFTDRKINVTHECDAFRVLKGGDGSTNLITVETVGAVNLTDSLPSSTTYYTRPNNMCEDNPRCLTVQVFEPSPTNPWYYVCNISFGQTINDPQGRSRISDFMAQIAIGSIAQIGFKDTEGSALQVYPRDSPWGHLANGDSDQIGITIAIFSLSSISGAARFNPPIKYQGEVPTPGFALKLNHKGYFYITMGVICLFHIISVVVWAFLSNKVKVQLGGPIEISKLLSPLADSFSKDEGKRLREARLQTHVLYKKDPFADGEWYFKKV